MSAGRSLGHHLAWGGIRVLQGLGAVLPLRTLCGLGGMLGGVARRFAPKDMKRARQHLEIAFPAISDEAREKLLQASMRHLGRTAAETLWLLRASASEVDEVCDICGQEHLFQALESGKGAVLITGHLGNWELLNARLGTAGIPMTIAVKDVYDPRVDNLATALRSRFGSQVVHRGRNAGARLFEALNNNRVNGLLIDQDIRDIPGVHVPFFGRPALTPIGAAQLALKAGCPIVPAFVHRKADGKHLAEVFPPLDAPIPQETRDQVVELTAAATAAIESQIRRFPEQWVWMHRRWRTPVGGRRKKNEA